MASPADRFTRMEKLAIFLIALGQKRTREVLADVDLNTIEHLNAAIRGLGAVSAGEKASVMLEFAQFFYGNEDITELGHEPAPLPDVPASPPGVTPQKGDAPADSESVPADQQDGAVDWVLPGSEPAEPATPEPTRDQSEEERAILSTLETLRQRIDPGQIDWGRAGYDFGDGFKGPDQPRR